VEGLACASVSLRLLITVSRTSLHALLVLLLTSVILFQYWCKYQQSFLYTVSKLAFTYFLAVIYTNNFVVRCTKHELSLRVGLFRSRLSTLGTRYHPTLDPAILWTPSNDTWRPIFSDSHQRLCLFRLYGAIQMLLLLLLLLLLFNYVNNSERFPTFRFSSAFLCFSLLIFFVWFVW